MDMEYEPYVLDLPTVQQLWLQIPTVIFWCLLHSQDKIRKSTD